MGRSAAGLTAVVAAVAAAGAIASSAAAAGDTQAFDASFTGTFAVSDPPGASSKFVVSEAGRGEDATLGGFEYTTRLVQDFNRPPEGCGPFSSTGVGGRATLSFATGTLRLHRTTSSTCVSFPTIDNTDRWVVASGTGAYRGASGVLIRHFVGDELTSTSQGTITGTIRVR